MVAPNFPFPSIFAMISGAAKLLRISKKINLVINHHCPSKSSLIPPYFLGFVGGLGEGGPMHPTKPWQISESDGPTLTGQGSGSTIIDSKVPFLVGEV